MVLSKLFDNNKQLMTSLLFCLVATIATECRGQTDLVSQLARLRASQPADYDEMIDSILKSKPTTGRIADVIKAGTKANPDDKRKEKLVEGWSAWEATDIHGVTRPYQLFLPKSIVDSAAPKALIVHMHGAVGRPEFGTGVGKPMAIGYAGMLWPNVAEEEDFIVVCPIGRDECAWWTDNGVAHVNAVIRDLRRSVDFPEESIFGAGFSDGASGCYYRAMATPDPFAGFIALNGHPRVAASASGKQLYLGNMSMSLSLAAMTQNDSLYPSKNVLPHILAAIREGADILTLSYPKLNHQPGYFKDQTPAIVSFINRTKRARRDRIKWYASSPEVGKFQWLELLEFANSQNAVNVEHANVMSLPGTRMQLGIQFSGFNLIEKVVEDSAAAVAGVKAADELIQFDGQKVTNSSDLRDLLKQKTYGDKFVCKVKRGDSVLELPGLFPEFVSKPVYLHDNPTGWAECRFDLESETSSIEVESENVMRLRVWLPEKMKSLETVSVKLNGKPVVVPVRRQSTEEMLKSYAESPSSFTAEEAYVELEIATGQ
jgi:predicted esterase